jgi:predicted HTH transcriptional regulator
LTPDALETAIALGREQRGTEFKGPGLCEKLLLVKVIKAILAMANNPDGGVVVIGVEDAGTKLVEHGLTQQEVDSWSYDHLMANVSNYADPYVDVQAEVVNLNSKLYVAVSVSPFDEQPIICKRGYEKILRKGAIYTRPIGGKIESIEVPSHLEMREIIDRAAEVRARQLIAQSQRLQLIAPITSASPPAANDDQLFADETKDLP